MQRAITSEEARQHITVDTLSRGNAVSACWREMKMKTWSNAGVRIELRQQGDTLEVHIENMLVNLLCSLFTNDDAKRKDIQTTTHFLRETTTREIEPVVLGESCRRTVGHGGVALDKPHLSRSGEHRDRPVRDGARRRG